MAQNEFAKPRPGQAQVIDEAAALRPIEFGFGNGLRIVVTGPPPKPIVLDQAALDRAVRSLSLPQYSEQDLQAIKAREARN